jgi:hypothetical protein
MEREAERERRPTDPGPTRRPQARRTLVGVAVALVLAIGLLAVMWINNTRYDGSSPVPTAEQGLRK